MMPYRRPLSNMFSDQLFATGSIIDLMKWDSTCLDSMEVPNKIDRTDVINCILEKYGDQTLAHPDPEYMRHYTGTWSKRRLPIWEKLLATTQLDYNPIYNFDRTEEYKDKTEHVSTGTNTLTSKDSGTSTVSGHIDRLESSEQKVSAENVSTYQPDERTDNTIGESTSQTTDTAASAEDSGSSTMDENTTFEHSARIYGNIGVTTTQQMIEAERNVVRYSVIEEIANDFRDAFCLGIY